MREIFIMIATVLGISFPSFLIKAIRSEDEEVASNNTIKACLTFGGIVFILLLFANSR